MTVMGVAALGLAACGGKDDSSAKVEKAQDKAVASGIYTEANYMEGCKMGMSETQCNCMLDFYGSIGLEISDMADQAKVQAAVMNISPDQSMKMMQCMQ